LGDYLLPQFFQENIAIIDFGKTYATGNRPDNYTPAAGLNYMPPEMRFDDLVSNASDVWALGCLIYEIRAGSALFSSCCARERAIMSAVALLGKMPERWWNKWEFRHKWFDEDGRPKQTEGPAYRVISTTFEDEIRRIGRDDLSPSQDQRAMIEKTGTLLEEEEAILLGDLLEKMVRWEPEDRISMDEVVRHPWFSYC
jgi:serine/threonine-protein kinase SRPK3